MSTSLQLLEEIFAPNGLLAKVFPKYELRESQLDMAKKIWEAFQEEKSFLIEAGTGTGKSLAYLIPTFLWIYQTGEKVVLSTYTIALQEQLFVKDIPLLLHALDMKLRIKLVKGMNNYLCLRKYKQFEKQREFFEENFSSEIAVWTKETLDGTKSTLPFAIEDNYWKKLQAESESCVYAKCPDFKRCFFFKARNALEETDLLIVNHHLLLTHLLQEEKQPILPSFSRVILDEAHHLEPVTQKALANTLDRVEIFHLLARIHSDHLPETSRLHALRDLLREKIQPNLTLRLENDLPILKRNLIEKIHQAFEIVQKTYEENSSEQKWRLPKEILLHWQIHSPFEEMIQLLDSYTFSIEALISDVRFLQIDHIKEKIEEILTDLENSAQKIQVLTKLIREFFSHLQDVFWIEMKEKYAILIKANLEVSSFLKEQLFQRSKTNILCSATLTTNQTFTFICKKLGLEMDAIWSQSYPSPFEFAKKAKLLVTQDLPFPDALDFVSHASQCISEAIEASKGGAFVLFTSYDMLQKCYEILRKIPSVILLKQGDLSRHLLLEEFRACKNGVLLGTDSFWEGVDVVGEALRLVIIVKLPFPVPSDPILQARAEKLKKEGKDPFKEEALPYAVMKFKQGFGRLIRSYEDRGCVLCLDKRLIERFYGSYFVKSLPECLTFFGSKKEVLEELISFYRNGA